MQQFCPKNRDKAEIVKDNKKGREIPAFNFYDFHEVI